MKKDKIFDAFIIKKANGELTDMNTLYSFALTAIRKKCKTLQKKIQILFCTEKYKSCETALMLNKSIGAVFLFTVKEKSLYLSAKTLFV